MSRSLRARTDATTRVNLKHALNQQHGRSLQFDTSRDAPTTSAIALDSSLYPAPPPS